MPNIQLALDGGTPTLGSLPSWPTDHAHPFDLLSVVQRAPDSEPWGQPMVQKLERRWGDATGRAHVVACRSGRAALALALAGLELEPGDEVICPGDAIPLARAIAQAGYTAVAADLHPVHLHLDPNAVEAAVTGRTRAVVAVDSHGTTADYRSLTEICRHHGLSLIEDGSQSLGAIFDQRPVGSHGDASICSFVGEDLRSNLGTAGVYATDDEGLAMAARRRLMVNNEASSQGFEPDALSGWSCQLAELDAAVCEAQLRTTWSRLATRVRNGRHLRRRLAAIPGVWVPDPVRSASHVYTSLPLVVMPDELGLGEHAADTLRDTVIDCLTAEGLWVDRWAPQPFSRIRPSSSTDEPWGGDQWTVRAPGSDELPVASALVATGLVLGQDRCPFDDPNDTATMDRIADCFTKIFVDNADRLRTMTEERRQQTD
ncbi:MAG: DegT/DnrJ/EryC1/StrS family aminotransferase [Actinomycetota bacterium]